MKTLFALLTFFSLLTSNLFAQFLPDFRLTNTIGPNGSNLSRNNAFCVASSGNVVHVVWVHDRSIDNSDIYYKRSADGGATWGATIQLTNDVRPSRNPSIAVSGSTVHVVWDDARDPGPPEIYYKRSADGGLTWGADTRLTNDFLYSDYPSVTVSGSVVHVVWNNNTASNIYQILYKRSADGGITWSANTQLTNSTVSAGFATVSMSGSLVHVTWDDARGGTWYETYYKRSADGGLTWSADTQLSDNANSNSHYSCHAVSGSVVHVVWTDDRHGLLSDEIYYKRSADGGLTWGPDVRLTNAPDRSRNPSISISGSDVHIVWEDNRDPGASGTGEIYYKRSPDGGLTWGADTRLTNNPALSVRPFVATSGTDVHIVWVDNRDVTLEIYYKRNGSTPPPTISASGPTTFCQGGSVTLTSSASSGNQWYKDGFAISGATNQTYVANQSGSYTVVATLNGVSSPPSLPVNVTVNPTPPTPTVTASGPASFCQGGSVTLTSSASSGNQWYKDGVIISGATNQSYVANQSGNYTVAVTVNNCSSPPSSPISVVVSMAVTPSVTITASATSICAVSNITFSATPTNGGTSPAYQWKVNGINAGTDSNSFSSTALNNNDAVTVIMTSNVNCAVPPSAASNVITITVSSSLTPSVTVTASATSICAGTNVTFTTTPTNGGTSPAYQWKVNGINAGTNSNSFSSTALNNNDVVTVVMTSNASCAVPLSVTSNAITITVNSSLTPAVTIAASATTICTGGNVTFTATPTNGGSTPAYQWKVNGINAGTNSSSFSSTTLTNNSTVTVVMTSNASCASIPTATGNAITITVNSIVTPSVSIVASATVICSGTNVSFTATPVNGGSIPAFQWKVNGNNAGTNSATFSSTALNNNDAVTVVMTSNAPCITSSSANSNSITETVNPIPVINAGADKTISEGDTIRLNATASISSGSISSFLWTPATDLNNAAILNPVAKPRNTITYTVAATSAAGCSASDDVIITVVSALPVVDGCPVVISGLNIPRGFSPNGDGINDLWKIKGIGNYPGCTVKIFDRYGRELFYSVGYNTPWDGRYKGNFVPVDTYYYIIDLRNGSPVLSCYVTIIK